jgi:hypothetical protein
MRAALMRRPAADAFSLTDDNGAARLIWFLESRRGIERGCWLIVVRALTLTSTATLAVL